ncbi:YtnP family quorum-quenching lactonase [Enterococcus sp. LJL51]|uniref:YtnP family quorum-quenching lactonase n=1 Tax=Enterococcus sp. LJL51 TaxID=3416656 RepID=UPI003CF5153A
MDKMRFHDMTIHWLDGGNTAMDGGAMFGVVPKPLWSKKYPANQNNQIELPTDPILIQYQGRNILIDSGVGNGKLSEKQKRNFGVWSEPKIKESLAELALLPEDIDTILMTHMHFDHAGGLTGYDENGRLVSCFPQAKIIINETEWNEVRYPTVRSKSTYWKENWEAVEKQVVTFSKCYNELSDIELIHTGGHSNGHSIVKLTQKNEWIFHMADLMPTQAHQNPLWVLAYDDYPMDSIYAKERLLLEGYEKKAMFIFYHDAYYRMIQWSSDGKKILNQQLRNKTPFIPNPLLSTEPKKAD